MPSRESESRLACAMLLLESETWPPSPETLPSAERIKQKARLLSDESEDWEKACVLDLLEKEARGDVRVALLRTYLRKHGIELRAPPAGVDPEHEPLATPGVRGEGLLPGPPDGGEGPEREEGS